MKEDSVDLKMFPSAEEVFADRVEEHSKVLFPLFSVNLKQINPKWTGYVHMLQFNEDPYNREAVSSFNEYCKDRMIAFDVIEGKYSFKTDFKYFDLTPDWKEWFNKTKESYIQTKNRFESSGELITPRNEKGAIYDQIGGRPRWLQLARVPTDLDGNPMTFIAKVNSANYTDDSCTKSLYLFYSDKDKTAVIFYQIT